MTARAAPTRDALALADRIAALAAQHPMHVALAIVITECAGASQLAADDLVSWRDVGVSKRHWHGLIGRGELTAVRVGRAHMARRADWLALCDRRRVQPRRVPSTDDAPARPASDLDRVLALGLGVEAAQ